MNTYHATMSVGDKTYRVTAKADSREGALQKIAHVAASSFPNQSDIKIEFDPDRVGNETRDFLKNIFGFK